MFLIVGRLAFAASSMDFKAIAKVFMPIRIRRHDRSLHAAQVIDFEEIIAAPPGVAQQSFIRVKS